MTTKAKTVKLVVFGRGGDTVYYAGETTAHGSSSCKSTGYGSPSKPHAADFSADHKAEIIVPDGTPCIDLTVQGCNIMYAVRGPMVDVDLPDGEIDKLTTERSPATAAMDIGFGGLLTAHDKATATHPNKPGPLDSVSTSQHVAAWRDNGARIGHYSNRQPVWEAP